jgi:hypothetical protein
MTITATFSNGTTDTYKGHRPVKAAWAIIRKSDGKTIVSGHSLDRAKAAKTAAGHVSEIYGYGYVLPTRAYPGIEKFLRSEGYEGSRSTSAMTAWARKHNAERRARIEADHIIEVVDI